MSEFEGPGFNFHKIGPFYSLKDGLRVTFQQEDFFFEQVIKLTPKQIGLIDRIICEAKAKCKIYGDKNDSST